jgi:hypothetical protein
MKKTVSYYIIWLIYLGLLAALLPHTQWAFRQLEPATSVEVVLLGQGTGITWADLVASMLAFAFEAGIAVFTHRLARRIETVKKVYKNIKKEDGSTERIFDKWGTFVARYGNSFATALMICAFVSGIANYSHAVEFSTSLAIFTKLPFFAALYPLAFGAGLPIVSLIFASALSNVSESEGEDDPAFTELKAKYTEVNRQLRELSQKFTETLSELTKTKDRLNESEARVKSLDEQVTASEALLAQSERRATESELRVQSLEDQLNGYGEVVKGLFGGDKQERILFVHRKWPTLAQAGIAVLAETSASHVSQVLKEAKATKEVVETVAR